MARSVTITEVAKQAGVSIKTVSRVVNGNDYVSAETRARVLEIIDQTGYRPSMAARSLRSGVDNTIGLAVDSVADPFFSEIVGAVEEYTNKQGFTVLVGSTKKEPDAEKRLVDAFLERQVAGIISVPSTQEVSWLTQLPVPVVFLDRAPKGHNVEAVVVEDYEEAHAGVNHLIKHGHRRIALISDVPGPQTTVDRARGYRDALAENGLPAESCLIRMDCDNPTQALLCTRSLLDLPNPPTAIFCTGTRQALGVVAAMTSEERARTGLVSFGDFPIAGAVDPGVTVIRHNPVVIAKKAAELIIQRIRGQGAENRIIRLKLGILERGSGEIVPNPG